MKASFAADSMVGRLAKWLRILGYDTISVHIVNEVQAYQFTNMGRILLTRNSRLKKKLEEEKIVFILSNRLEEQLAQLVHMNLINLAREHLFSRCIRCNNTLERAGREEVMGMIPDYIFDSHKAFSICPNCKRIYWPGSHHERIVQFFKKFFCGSPMPEMDSHQNTEFRHC
jgi:uncharacterized protein